jgi:ESCRT-II complex subunit VPS25
MESIYMGNVYYYFVWNKTSFFFLARRYPSIKLSVWLRTVPSYTYLGIPFLDCIVWLCVHPTIVLKAMARLSASASFDFPQLYNFPPMFTIQPVEQTRLKQMESWRDILIKWVKHTKKASIDVNKCEIFENTAINRKLSEKDRVEVLDYLVGKGNGDWVDDTKSRCLVFWNSLGEWAKLVYDWASTYGQVGNVFTLYDLVEGEETEGAEFHGLDKHVFYRVIAALQERGLCQVYASSNMEETGVKFLPS